MKSSDRNRVISVWAGICAALVIVATQLFYVEVNEQVQSEIDTEQQNSPSGEQDFISLPSSFSMPSSAHVVLNHEFSFIEELLLDTVQSEVSPVGKQLSTGKLFKALFHFIISPNAP